jgi:S-adenosylmethionine hydrolase
MIVLFTDYGAHGPYVGQLTAMLVRHAPLVPVVNLFADAPAFDVRASAYLLPAYAQPFPAGTVFLSVVDPGVGGARGAGALHADGRWYVAPDNGLLELVARRAEACAWYPLGPPPPDIPATFHGRDWFAPVAARLALGQRPEGGLQPCRAMRRPQWPDDLPQVVYVDRFGNAVTGTRFAALPPDATVAVAGEPLPRARTFGDVPVGAAFCYDNANGLLEIAVNQGRACDTLALSCGAAVDIVRM